MARLLELVAVFVGIPAAMRLGLLPVPRLAVLAAVTAAGILLLLRDPTFDRRGLWSLDGLRSALPGILLRAAGAGVAIAGLVLLLSPERFLALPTGRPAGWAAGLILYPFLSAWPQEVLYRVAFFHRYAGLFPGRRALLVANALAFSALHLVYPNAVAPLLSLPAGLLLARTYERTGSMAPVWIEHVLYGALLFTLGLDPYFWDGRP
jgi:hypothetical protein